MGKIESYRDVLAALDRTVWPTYLSAHSGLPGPRGKPKPHAAAVGYATSAFALLPQGKR